MGLLSSKHQKDTIRSQKTYEGKSDEEDKDKDSVQEAVVNKTKEKETIKIVKSKGEFDMLMRIVDIDRFERLNNVQINVFWYLSDELIPVWISKELQKNICDGPSLTLWWISTSFCADKRPGKAT